MGTVLTLAAIAAVAVVMPVLLFLLPRWVVPDLPGSDLAVVSDPKDRLSLRNERTKMRNDFRTTCVQAVGGVALLAGVVITYHTASSSQRALVASLEVSQRQNKVAERNADQAAYSTALTQLYNADPSIRLAAVGQLEDLSRTGPESLVSPIAVVLATFVRQRAAWPSVAYPPETPLESVPDLILRQPDVEYAIGALVSGRLDAVASLLTGDLRNANFTGYALAGKDLRDAHLEGATLTNADLRGARLYNIHLRAADLSSAKLCGAALPGAELAGAVLTGALADASTSWPEGFDVAAAGVLKASDSGTCTRS